MSRNVANALIAYPATVPLHNLQRVNRNRFALRIVRRLRLNLVNFFPVNISSSPVHIRQYKIQAAQIDHQIRNHQSSGQ